MPTYEYKCLKCGNKFESFQKITDPPHTECPSCKGEVKRLIGTGLAPILKGSGFYQTDYKNAKPAESSKETAPKEAPKEKPKTDKKEK